MVSTRRGLFPKIWPTSRRRHVKRKIFSAATARWRARFASDRRRKCEGRTTKRLWPKTSFRGRPACAGRVFRRRELLQIDAGDSERKKTAMRPSPKLTLIASADSADVVHDARRQCRNDPANGRRRRRASVLGAASLNVPRRSRKASSASRQYFAASAMQAGSRRGWPDRGRVGLPRPTRRRRRRARTTRRPLRQAVLAQGSITTFFRPTNLRFNSVASCANGSSVGALTARYRTRRRSAVINDCPSDT